MYFSKIFQVFKGVHLTLALKRNKPDITEVLVTMLFDPGN